MDSINSDRTAQLQKLMQQAGFSSFKALSATATVSEKQIRALRQGKLQTVRLETLVKLSRALQIAMTELVAVFVSEELTASEQPSTSGDSQAAHQAQDVAALRQEYDRLLAKLEQQKQELWQEFQQSSWQTLESLLLQLPTAAYAAQQNPNAPAVKLLPLLRPIDVLLQQWGIEAIASVGSEVAYDPQQHQLMEGNATPGDRVRVRYIGYRQGEKLLYRAKVSPV
ncbi:MAG: helix-turn-helix transcriptional regulator [Oscillatoriales cyanobacterium C42_A2020_001]|nr:helix-turn-helix transcriptional regulator [Leptolyngbyaceae cyanobacterium C42_A2020_001]